MTCRDEILQCVESFELATGRTDFMPKEIIDRMLQDGSRFEEGTIRTHIVSRLCADAPPNHGTRYPDLVRVSDRVYRRNPQSR